MKTIAMIGASLATLALIVYTTGALAELKRKKADRIVLTFFTAGFLLDITATACMILGSSKGILTLHGLLGYSALCAMCAATVFLWKWRIKNGSAALNNRLYLGTRLAWIWWVVIYITGGLLVALKFNPVIIH